MPAVEIARHNGPPHYFGVLDDSFLCSWKRDDTMVDQNVKKVIPSC